MRTIALVILGLVAFFCLACAQPECPGHEIAWDATMEAAWQDVLACWSAKGVDASGAARPDVLVRDDCRTYWQHQDYRSGSEWFFGRYFVGANDVEVCPDFGALRHELSHAALDGATGYAGVNVLEGDGGCYSVARGNG